MPSSAISEVIGLRSLAYSASTQCAIAFMPDGPDTAAGRLKVRTGS
jgi:hypothetical protein